MTSKLPHAVIDHDAVGSIQLAGVNAVLRFLNGDPNAPSNSYAYASGVLNTASAKEKRTQPNIVEPPA